MKYWQLTVVVIALISAGVQAADGQKGVLYVPEIGALKSTRDDQLTAIENETAQTPTTDRTRIANVDMQGHLSDGATPTNSPRLRCSATTSPPTIKQGSSTLPAASGPPELPPNRVASLPTKRSKETSERSRSFGELDRRELHAMGSDIPGGRIVRLVQRK